MHSRATPELRERWLPATLRNALRTRFYQEHWAGVDVSRVDVETLSRLPVVTKEQIKAAGRNAQVREGLICDEVFTTGTTGPPLVIVRGRREQQAIRDLFAVPNDKRCTRRLRRALKFRNYYHGTLVKIPLPVHCHRVCVYDAGGFQHARSVLGGRHEDERVEPLCSLLIGGERCLRAFTYDTYHYFPEARENHLDCIISCGEYLTRRWRRLLEDTWDAPVIDRFSMSEIFGGATQSLICGWWHFDPYVIAEVIGANSGRPITEGEGLLVLTALYPFQEAQPLVRYTTGDLVEVTHTRSSRPGEIAIKPLGRAAYGVALPATDQWILTPAWVLESVDTLPGIERAPLFRDSAQVRDPWTIGLPKYQVSSRYANGTIEADILVGLKHGVSPVGKEDIQQRLLTELQRNCRSLAGHLASGVVKLSIHFEEKPPNASGD